ncbi:MAG: LytTR family DNA-binding domain-containing protein [Lachnospiraceae bacterium]|nr:LytTR family DNA-binding domain-containing protein [Lachnospiraceae bacterium]
MFHIVVCDDDPVICAQCKQLLDHQYKKKAETTVLTSAAQLSQWLEEKDRGLTNIILLDIALGEADGIELAKDIRRDYPQIKVILLSGYAQLASNVFDADPVYFLSKPIDPEKLYASVDRAMKIVASQEVKAVTVTGVGGKIFRIKVDELIYVETSGRNCVVYLDNGVVREINCKLSELISMMPDYVVATHQSYGCNLHKVKAFSKEDGIDLVGGVNIPVSRRHYKGVKEKLALHMV